MHLIMTVQFHYPKLTCS